MTQYINTGCAPRTGYVPRSVLIITPYKIYDGDTLVHDVIPCVNPQGVRGLYDRVTEIFTPEWELVVEV